MQHLRVQSVCLHYPQKVMEIGGIEYYAASESGIPEFNGDLVVNFSGRPNIPNLNPKFSTLLEHFNIPFQEIMIPWPDFETPMTKASIWRALHEMVKSNGFKRVCLHCQGGHGRTGTALASLIIATVGKNANEAVDYIREIYCRKAVETYDQCIYLQEMDLFYNNREMNEELCPIPSTVLEMIEKVDDKESVEVPEYKQAPEWYKE